MQAEGRGLRDQQAEISPRDGLHYGAGGAGCGIDNGGRAVGDVSHRLLDDADGGWFAWFQPPLDEAHAPGGPHLDLADPPGLLPDRALGARQGAASAAMTELREHQHLIADHSQSVELAELRAPAAERAPVQIHLRHHHLDRNGALEGRVQEQVSVGLLGVGVHELALRQRQR
jgi:hypothetical protein